MNHKMEDAATAEISRAQIWQWQRHGVHTQDDDVNITKERIRDLVAAEVSRRRSNLSDTQKTNAKWLLAGKLVSDMLTKDKLDNFLTSVCYPHILKTAYEGSVIPDAHL
jgi:malate synthase